MIMIVKTPGSQMGFPAAAEEGGEDSEVGGGRWESGERSEVQARSTLTSTAPKARSRSGEIAPLDDAEDFAESVIEIAVIDIVVVVVGHHSARTDIGIAGNDGSIRANIVFLVDSVSQIRKMVGRPARRGA